MPINLIFIENVLKELAKTIVDGSAYGVPTEPQENLTIDKAVSSSYSNSPIVGGAVLMIEALEGEHKDLDYASKRKKKDIEKGYNNGALVGYIADLIRRRIISVEQGLGRVPSYLQGDLISALTQK